jgi:hypothetical protein
LPLLPIILVWRKGQCHRPPSLLAARFTPAPEPVSAMPQTMPSMEAIQQAVRRLIAHKAVPEPSSARLQASIHSLVVRFMSKSSLSRLSKSGMWAAP